MYFSFIFNIFISNLCFAETGALGSSQMVLGIGVHLWGRDKVSIDKHLEAAKQGGFKVIRWDVPWKAVEIEKGKLKIPDNWDYIVNKANSYGIKSLLVLDYGNKFYDNGDKPTSQDAVQAFARYSQFVVSHFKGRVTLYQVWNEWDGEVGNTTNGKAVDYARLLKSTYPSIKAADKNAFVIGASFSTGAYDSMLGLAVRKDKEPRQLTLFFDENMADYMDAVAIHPYVVYRSGDMRNYQGFAMLLKTLVSKIKATPGFGNKPIFITELGWSTASNDPRGVTEDEQANNMLSAKNLASSLGIATFIAYELIDANRNPSDLESNFGFMRFNWSKKPIFERFCTEQ